MLWARMNDAVGVYNRLAVRSSKVEVPPDWSWSLGRAQYKLQQGAFS